MGLYNDEIPAVETPNNNKTNTIKKELLLGEATILGQ